MALPKFDLAVIGSGPAGQKGAIAAAKLGRKVAVVDREERIGGMCLHGGTIPTKTLREAILYLTGFRQRSFYGRSYHLKDRIAGPDLVFRVRQVIEREVAVVRDQLQRNGITVLPGVASFYGTNTLAVNWDDRTQVIEADHVLVACGTRPARHSSIPFDGSRVLDADELPWREELPRDMIVVGAGVIGLEYASMLTALGIDVTLIDQRSEFLDFVDHEIVEALSYHMRRQGTTFRLGEKVTAVDFDDRDRVVIHTESGKHAHAAGLLYTVGRQPNSDCLDLAAAGITTDERGRIPVNEHYQTAVPHIYAVGDVIGFPALASSSMEQGRLASVHMFGAGSHPNGGGTAAAVSALPYGIYTIPEISMVGRTERELTRDGVPYETGISRFEELAKGQIAGDTSGMLKLIFHPDTRKLLGVHVLGESAAEIVHIGQAVLSFGGSIDYFRDAVFNYPTFAEAYKVAAFDGLNKL